MLVLFAATIASVLDCLNSASFQNVPQLPCGKALYSYEGKEPGDLKFNKGDIIILRRKVDENWFHGELNGSHGFLPASYIQCIKPLSQTPPQGKALYDFEVKDKDQDKDCLAFTKDEILTVIRRVDDNWAEGMLGDKIGIFPILYVELNEPAKQLMELDKLSPVPGPSTEPGSPAGPCSGPGPTLNGNGPPGGIHRRADGKKNAKKRHSFTALSATQRTAQALNNRHSMEISAPVLISSSDPRAAARIGDCPHLASSPPQEVTGEQGPLAAPSSRKGLEERLLCSHDWGNFPTSSEWLPRAQSLGLDSKPLPLSDASPFVGTSNVAAAVPPRVASVAGELLAVAKVQLPLNIYLALYAYKPQKADELELRKGEMYRVTEKCQDGWFKGTSLCTGGTGVFPGNYVTPVSRAPFAMGQSRACLSSPAPVAKVVPSSPGSPGPSSPVLMGSSSRSIPPLANTSSSSSSSSSPQLQPAALHLKNCLRNQQTSSQARTSMQLVHSPPAGSLERPTAAVPPLRPHGSPTRSPGGPSSRPLSMGSPQHSHQPPSLSPAAVRPAIPLSSAASAITPPNVSAAHLNGEASASPPLGPPSPAHPQGATAGLPKLEEKKPEKKEKKSGGLLKLLSGAAAKKKSRSPPSVSPTHEPQGPCDSSHGGAMGPALHPASGHGRAGSCPIESEMQGAMGMEPLHRKSGSLDLNFSVSPPSRQPCSALLALRPEPKPLSRERYRVVVSYPPQSEAEIELKEGDIVFVHKKREDGWYKGTLQRTGRTGLFPGSFVESF
ncbi:hypothetical protein COCON_G00047140 [Conger conger]|uniref:RING-type E3 ubiquitin transferase n=1 Tax=Conger conger TaxID=82655 RepID=A0A9Q1I574_CONCO|nr:hypothetical protein COCON_G00047140 [Conger conger]